MRSRTQPPAQSDWKPAFRSRRTTLSAKSRRASASFIGVVLRFPRGLERFADRVGPGSYRIAGAGREDADGDAGAPVSANIPRVDVRQDLLIERLPGLESNDGFG